MFVCYTRAMTVDTSDKAYQQYLENHELTRRTVEQMRESEGQRSVSKFPEVMSYDQWAKTMHYREHPRWVQYAEARAAWKQSVFHLVYGAAAARTVGHLTFPDFPEWLLAVEEVNRDYPDLAKKEKTNG